MRHSRTWISRHREDQKDITCLCIYMAFLLAFHLVMRELLIFSMVTLRMPTRLTAINESFPYEVLNGVVLIACLMLACSLVHLAGSIRRRLAIKLMTTSLVVSSCCLIANATILRNILKSADPRVIANIAPQTVIIDVDRRGRVSHNNYLINLSAMKRLLESPLKHHSSTPIIICADKRTLCSNIWNVVKSCRESGATSISMARQEGFDRYASPIFNEQSVPRGLKTNLLSSILVYRHAFVLNDRTVNRRDMASVMSDYVKQRTGHWYSIEVAENAPYENVLVLLHAFQDCGATNLVWERLQ